MDETRAINGNMPNPDIYRTKAASAADDGDGGGLGNTYERHDRRREADDEETGAHRRPQGGINDATGSDPLLQALDRMAAVEGYRPVDQNEVAHAHAERVYGSTTIKRKQTADDSLPKTLSKLEQHGALEAKRVDELVTNDALPFDDDDDEYLPHPTARHSS